jgi:hypothetical protein
MGWIRFSDDFYDNDKLSEVGPLGIALHVAATGFCNRNLTDGYFKKSKARLLLDFDGIGITTASSEMFAAGVDGDDAVKLVVEWMLAADLWHEFGHDCDDCHARSDGGEPSSREFLIHDYLKYQPSRSEVERKAAATKERVAKWRSEHGGNDVGNSVTNDVRTRPVTPSVQHTPTPNPTPSNSSLVTSSGEGYVSNARGPRPPCSKHLENSEDEKCRACMKRRKWDEAEEADAVAAALADELDAKRRQKDARENCVRCEGTNTYIDEAGDTHKCNPHQEAM